MLLGAVAQLGEHLLCKQGVTGSIPVGSTSIPLRCGTGVRLAYDRQLLSVSGLDMIIMFIPDPDGSPGLIVQRSWVLLDMVKRER
tara:strand:- start:740 stop:994 length:255 start_codon:yes stop_codon:yes gene_type:complete